MYNSNFKDGSFGLEAVLDFHDCDFTHEDIISFVPEIVRIADMEAHDEPIVWEDDESEDLHLRGISIFQWIKTSNIVVHALDHTKLVMLNLFSCKPFDPVAIADFGQQYLKAKRVSMQRVPRGTKRAGPVGAT